MIPFQALQGRPYAGRICSFGSTVFALDERRSKYERRWLRGFWRGKDGADQDIVAFEGERLVRARAVRLCAKEYDKELLICLTITETLKKAATHGMMKSKLRELRPPEPVLHPTNEDPDEKAVQDYHEQHPEGSDEEEYTPSDPGRAHEVGVEQVAKKPRLEVVEDKGSSSSGAMDTSQQKESNVHPIEGGSEEQPAKAYKHSEETSEHTAKAARTGMYSPTFAGDTRQVQEHYVDEQADLLEEWQFDEESRPELDIEMDFSRRQRRTRWTSTSNSER